MVRLIINILFLIILAVFIALNASYKTSVNIFGFKAEDVSVVAVIIVTMVIGVVYSFFFYASNYLVKLRKQKLKQLDQSSRQLENELKDKGQNVQVTETENDSSTRVDSKSGRMKKSGQKKNVRKFISSRKKSSKK